MNKHDSEKIAGLLAAQGYTPTSDPNSTDILIFNTCCVRQRADQKLYGQVSAIKTLKNRRPDTIIAVGGCLAQRDREKLLEKFSHIDIVFGTHNLSHLPSLVEEVRSGGGSICEIWDEVKRDLDRPSQLALREKSYHGWVPITRGCNNFCSYCIVPYVRGREVSRPLVEICTEVSQLALDGVLEITLLGQNVNSYGRDLTGKNEFATLLRALQCIEGIKRIRFTTSHPRDLSDEIIKAVANLSKVCEHLHLPFQAGSDRVLKKMNRGYSKADYLRLAEKIYATVPGVSLTTDIMVGFPGETEQDFAHTLDLVEKVRFDQAFTFIFSPRQGTTAAKMKSQVSKEVKLKRFNRLLEVQNEISLAKNRTLVGKTVEVLVEGPSKKDTRMLSGRTRTNKVVNFPGDKKLIHQTLPITIKEAHTWSLKGKLKTIS